MNRKKFLAATAFTTGSLFLQLQCQGFHFKPTSADLIIRQGLIYDGSGRSQPQIADIAIKDGRIIAIGDINLPAGRTFSARGKIVCPGFIDLHSHSDYGLLSSGFAHSKIYQGVTTEIIGQDGRSMAPLNDSMQRSLNFWLPNSFGYSADWTTFGGYYERLLTEGISVNIMSMVGAGTLRQYAGLGAEIPDQGHYRTIRNAARQARKDGVRHLSSGLEYLPGSHASKEELIEIASHFDLYATHLRSEEDRVVLAIKEAIEIGQASGTNIHISHLKTQGRSNWFRIDDIFAEMNAARSQRFAITCDRYPYIAYNSRIITLFPLWSRENGSESFLANLRNHRERIRDEVERKINSTASYGEIMISSAPRAFSSYIGRTFQEIARQQNRPPYNVIEEMMLQGNGSGSMVVTAMSEDNLIRILQDPYCAIASDGAAMTTEQSGIPHPRSFGTFPRILARYVRDLQALTMKDAIYKMTGLPASILGLPDRGLIREGYAADIVVFDPEQVEDRATFQKPAYPSGIEYVIVNGELVIREGLHTGMMPGIVY